LTENRDKSAAQKNINGEVKKNKMEYFKEGKAGGEKERRTKNNVNN